jgi:hypothetical protein
MRRYAADMAISRFALVGVALAAGSPILPASYFAQDTYIRFERDGYRGNVYLNQDRTYVIVQTGPDRVTRSFLGKWREHGTGGFCIDPERGAGGKCFTEMPASIDQAMTVVSDLGETYHVTLKAGR